MAGPSFRELEPLEQGGVENRQGIAFQDHVAGGFFLDMVLDLTLAEVWCESQDDITLVWSEEGDELVEYVQVKGQRSRAWSIAVLCSGETAQGEASNPNETNATDGQTTALAGTILENLLANDRAKDGVSVKFRIVVRQRHLKEIEPLFCPFGSDERKADNLRYIKMCEDFISRLPDARSENSHDVIFWIERTRMQFVGEEEHVIAVNIKKIDAIVKDRVGEPLHPDQKEYVYKELIALVFDAGKSRVTEEKRWDRTKFIDWLDKTLNRALQIRPTAPQQGALKTKMAAASIGNVYQQAWQAQVEFRNWIRSPGYMSTVDPTEVQARVSSTLLKLKLELDVSGEAEGVAFHLKCIDALQALSNELFVTKGVSVPANLLHGCMYDIAGRCGHRWVRSDNL